MKIVEAIYENGVLKPLEKLDLKEGEKVRIKIERDVDKVIDKYVGIFGTEKASELKKIEEAFYK